MIKKSVFEDELIAGMQRELQPFQKKAAINDLGKAAEYLHSAMEIFEDAGMSAKADQVLRILGKIALADKEEEDKYSCSADDNEIAGKKNKDFYENVMRWIEDPESPLDPENPQPGEVIEMESVLNPPPDAFDYEAQRLPAPKKSPDEELVFKSIAQELGLVDDNFAAPSRRKPKNPTKVSDSHTKGLSSEKMLSNLEEHGTVFNMADDGSADDILNLEIAEEPLEVMEPSSGKTFEDSD